jgi:hypothetical protein
MPRVTPFVVLATASFATASFAQPEVFTDLGGFAAPLTPPSQVSGAALVVGGDAAPEILTVKWYRFFVDQEISAPAFFQTTTTASTVFAGPANVSLALYNAAGGLVATEFGGESAGLSFGSTLPGPRSAGENYGRDGATLPVGEYYLAVAAGGSSSVTAGATDWNVTTTSSLLLDLDNLFGAYALTLALSFGNTDPTASAPPANDECANALVVTDGQTWIGSNELANADGDLSCYNPLPGETFPDVWFKFTPASSGVVNAFSNVQDASDAVLPALARFDGCGQPSVQCGQIEVSGGNVGTRLIFDAVGGRTYFIALGGLQGNTGPINFTVNLTPAAGCDSVDFNNDSSLFDPTDIDAFFSVFSEGPCVPATATCNDVDFNNDGSLFDPCDVDSFLLAFSEGPCTLCGQ